MKKTDSLGARERALVEERQRTGYRTHEARRYGAELEQQLRALVARLLPGVDDAELDLAAFVDTHADNPLGRGDRAPGVPPRAELFHLGLEALARRNFAALPASEQDALVGRLRRGELDGELGFPARDFVDRLLVTALAGYLAHPSTWERIGFMGPAYPMGYAWISGGAVAQRHAGYPGAGRL